VCEYIVIYLALLLQDDIFELKALDIGKVLSITVGHSSVGRGRGWYCAGLQLRIDDDENQLVFPCDRLVQLTIHFILSSVVNYIAFQHLHTCKC